MNKRAINELLSTSALTALATTVGTAALVGLHHYYRKQRQPDARLQDYLMGINIQLTSLASAPFISHQSISATQFERLQYAYQQATSAWQQAYHDGARNAEYNEGHIADFSALHTTTMLARPVCWVSGVASMPHVASLINGEESANGFGVVGIDADRQIVWQTTMPERVHDIVVQPLNNGLNSSQSGEVNKANKHSRRDVVVMGRRPSADFWVLDTATGQVQFAIKAATDRHFYGHACYSLDGKRLYVTENDTVSLAGKIGIYEVNNRYQKVAEFDSQGIGPHELIMHPDGETLIIANGGIKTEQASREELNLDSMRPSLAYLNRHDGTLLEQVTPEHNQMSIRHLAMHDDGTVMIGIQFQGEKHINVPLVLTHQRGDNEFKPLIMPNNQWQRFHQYIASVAVDSQHNLLCVTTPIGGCAALYDLNTRELIGQVQLPDCAGASVLASNSSSIAHAGFIVSDGQGQLTTLWPGLLETGLLALDNDKQAEPIVKNSYLHSLSFDNHLQAL
ncbi:DUF1513 domain-containing protein [Psychrobacter frigidicola]|uniref:DUF1513 domain-containing protein n=1 Tax=Psychrobacter frigidicola TaxID=45611 RepID=A0A5C6ZZJ6_9GAMM|nr:DUF1513 domain-containing protein [Psychrobacter frigidicola]TXD96413.1 DUF1513 domain-containing protein [Psychrobacter frigidicola]